MRAGNSRTRIRMIAVALAAEVWESVLQSVSKTLQRRGGKGSGIVDLEAYLFGAFHHRFNRALKKERRRQQTIELVPSGRDLEQLPGARDLKSARDLEHSIQVKEVIQNMDDWTRRAWAAKVYGYTWKEIAEHMGLKRTPGQTAIWACAPQACGPLGVRQMKEQRHASGLHSDVEGKLGVSAGDDFNGSRQVLNEQEEFNQEEKRVLDLLTQGLSREFPNPQRVGCPDSAVLRGIAFRKLRLSEVDRWLEHLSSCSPCYQEFTELRKEAASQRRRTQAWLAVAAVLIFAVAGWLWVRIQHSVQPPKLPFWTSATSLWLADKTQIKRTSAL